MKIWRICMVVISTITMLVSGCIQNEQSEKKEASTNLIEVSIAVNYSEVVAINFTQTKDALQPLNFTFSNNTPSTSPNIRYTALDIQRNFPSHNQVTHITSNASTRTAEIHTISNAVVIPESYLEIEKQYIRNRTGQVASACSIMLNWTNAIWNVAYQD